MFQTMFDAGAPLLIPCMSHTMAFDMLWWFRDVHQVLFTLVLVVMHRAKQRSLVLFVSDDQVDDSEYGNQHHGQQHHDSENGVQCFCVHVTIV
jgi:hypothetical protein